MTLPDITILTDAELDQTRIAVLTEQDRRRIIATAKAQTDDLAARYAATQTDAAPIPWADVPDAIGPGVAVTWTDGNRWRNKSGTWLPKTATPATYPLGWSQETGLSEAVKPMTDGEWVNAGDLRRYAGDGLVYRAVQAHTTMIATYPPSATPSLWTLA